MKRYRAKIDLKRKPDGKFFRAGSLVELELTPELERKFIQQGYVEPVEHDTSTQSGSQNKTDGQQPIDPPTLKPVEEQQSQFQTLICPKCGNINAYESNKCLKCGLDLVSIRNTMAGTFTSGAKTTGMQSLPEEEQTKKPPIAITAIDDILDSDDRKSLGKYYQSRWRALIPGMANKTDRIVNMFFRQVNGREIIGLSVGFGRLEIDKEERDYYLLSRDLGEGALASMAVRFDATGKDLYLEWRHYELGRARDASEKFWRKIGGILCIYPGIALAFPLSIGIEWLKSLSREVKPTAFQREDSWAFREAVDLALREAFDLVGISKDLIREIDKRII